MFSDQIDDEDGNHYDLIYTLADSSWYESVTGQQRHYTLQPLETPPENYEPEPAQVGAYLTAPIGFSQHVIVYLQNLYAGSRDDKLLRLLPGTAD